MAQSPDFALVLAIVETSERCTRELDSIINFPTHYERRWQAIWIQFAYAMFFGHMALRMAYRKFGARGRETVAQVLCPMLIRTAVLSFESPEGALAEFRPVLQDIAEEWEFEYSRCAGFVFEQAPQKEITGNSILAALARNVLELSGYKVPVTDEQTGSWALADFVAAGKTRCRYTSDPLPLNPFNILLVQRLAITGIESLALPDHIETIMSQ